MSLRDGVIKAGTILYKKARVWTQRQVGENGCIDVYGTKFDPDKTSSYASTSGYAIVELIVLEDGLVPKKHRRGTRLNNSWDDGFRKVRVPKVYVKDVTPATGSRFIAPDEFAGSSAQYNAFLAYKVGTVVTPDMWDDNPDVVCTHGIHAFFTREEAESYHV